MPIPGHCFSRSVKLFRGIIGGTNPNYQLIDVPWVLVRMKKLTVFINDQVAYECDREIDLEPEQLKFLDKMDNDMDRGVKIQGELIASPDIRQRATFITMNLIKALQQENDAAKFASCAYLIKRMSSLVEVRASDQENSINIELIEEH